ncbi:aminotransferase class V-fold PLP-dependent enzyme [Nocardia goodfellowii]
MNPAATQQFPLDPGLIHLNHASYGITSRDVLTEAERIRYELESDPNRHLGAELTERLRTETAATAALFGLEAEQTTLCTNATAGAAAIINSLPLAARDTVVVLDTEYASMIRAWQLRCAATEACLQIVPVPLPFDNPDQLLAALDEHVHGPVTYLHASLVSSSTAIALPTPELTAWVRQRGGQLILDAAHGPGHTPLALTAWGVAAMHATLHKWLPTLRPVGLLWLAPEFIDHIRPAEVSLTWDSPDLVERFSWPGTFDPTPRLSLSSARDQWTAWRDSGELDTCASLADTATAALSALGARPTAAVKYQPPRLRSFILDRVSVTEVKTALHQAGIRAWVGPDPNQQTLLRISTHIYNDDHDIDTLADRIKEVLAR